ncbi:PLC-like phosphodiesterase [Stereum hirsutum FP-91666 SS1]|uniref:PLC-like phosphodiesterase n=1 Tax=Stereum hirsutum (strain FP-91666) TaxID=721885 RepID=UPI000444A165|nr:PLC-like phosphodiesterase [Stereum hirsutum FP-91666 SS1]EIM82925.1 PLC-like phosphodiesterase [Stereum hirsutum FP-91666 SS1]
MFSSSTITVLCVAISAFSSLSVSAAPSARRSNSQAALAQSALRDILNRGAPILGYDDGCSRSSRTCDWMAKVADNTKLVHMNLPGTHDSATWNYTQATQDSLVRYTGTIPAAEYFQCQGHSFFQMLNGGIRVFDLRFALNPGNDTIGFYHSQALLSPTTSIEDVFFGFYSWLDKHPTEAVLISLQYESGTGTENTEALQVHMYNLLNSDLAKKYWVQANGTLNTLGEARGKLTLLQRFDWSLLPDTLTDRFGLHLDPEDWTDNSPNISLTYNEDTGATAYIEDYYEIGLPIGAGAAENIQWKYNATTVHIAEAASSLHPDSLYISFASSEHTSDLPPETPRIMALGNGSDIPGVNQKLLPWLQERKGQRFGIVMLDFFDSIPGVVEAVIGL